MTTRTKIAVGIGVILVVAVLAFLPRDKPVLVVEFLCYTNNGQGACLRLSNRGNCPVCCGGLYRDGLYLDLAPMDQEQQQGWLVVPTGGDLRVVAVCRFAPLEAMRPSVSIAYMPPATTNQLLLAVQNLLFFVGVRPRPLQLLDVYLPPR
jgi:hypothetical protein